MKRQFGEANSERVDFQNFFVILCPSQAAITGT
jgi:hypothetical protein